LLDAALWSWRRADHDRQGARLEALETWARSDEAPALQARALAELALLHAEAGNQDAAREHLARARALVPSPHEAPAHAAWVHIRCDAVLRLQGAARDARPERAVELARLAGEREVETLGLLQLAVDADRAGDQARARSIYDDALAAARATGNRALEARALASLGWVLEPAEREATFQRAAELARETGALRFEIIARYMQWLERGEGTERPAAREEMQSIGGDAARHRIRQIAALAELTCARWAIHDGDRESAARHRENAAELGAATGALPERAGLAAIDLVLALESANERLASGAVDTLIANAAGFRDPRFLRLLERARALAPADIAARLAPLLA
jgi:hypothetical protein